MDKIYDLENWVLNKCSAEVEIPLAYPGQKAKITWDGKF